MKEKTLESLNKNYGDLFSLYSELKKLSSTQVSKTTHKNSTKQLCEFWFDQIKPQLQKLKIDNNILDDISSGFSQLLNYSKKISRRSSYLSVMAVLQKKYQELIQHIEITVFEIETGLNISPYLEDLEEDEKDYLKEAEKCAQGNCIRASILLGWCATIDRIHRKIEALGFNSFNQTTSQMKAKTFGRFKRFKKQDNIDSLSELREVFDTDILWVLEFLKLIDCNQHERLRHCFLLRNNSGHPGEAPITGENLYSFYSDITKIILKNKIFDS